MKCFVILMLVCAAFAGKIKKPGKVCESLNDAKLKMFNGKAYFMSFPCNYYALRRQECGKWRLDMVPGVIWVGERFYLDSVRISATHLEVEGLKWEGKITNKVAIKYYNDPENREMFNWKDGSTIGTDSMLNTTVDKDKKEVIAMERQGGDFSFSFTPFDPRTSGFNHALFKFECFADHQSNVQYPKQMCGDQRKNYVMERAKAEPFDLPRRFDYLTVYYDLFLNSDVTQENAKCVDASMILNNTCQTFDQRMVAIRNCHQIISSAKHASCVNQYSCDPMDVFNACLDWACSDFDRDHSACDTVGKAIYMCPKFATSGELSYRAKKAGCFSDFEKIDKSDDIEVTTEAGTTTEMP